MSETLLVILLATVGLFLLVFPEKVWSLNFTSRLGYREFKRVQTIYIRLFGLLILASALIQIKS
jgi:hypothetical protein